MSFEQIRSLDPALQRIDELQRAIEGLKTVHPDAYARIMEGWAIESTYNSNNIEGSTLSLGDTALVYDGVRVEAPERDIRQAEGGFAALRFLRESVEQRAILSEALVMRAHELVFADAEDPHVRGAYRQTEVEITGTTFMPAPAIYVPERMESLVGSCSRSKRHPVITAALFHLEFESIHPFVNANGRTGRLISNFILMRAGYEPINVQAESRSRYINAIRSFQLDDDPFPFVEFFCTNLLERQERVRMLLSPQRVVAGTSNSDDRIAAYVAGDPVGAVDGADNARNGTDNPLVGTDNSGGALMGTVRITKNGRRILALLGEYGEMKSIEVATELGVSQRAASKALKKLVDAGAVESMGANRNRTYRLAHKTEGV